MKHGFRLAAAASAAIGALAFAGSVLAAYSPSLSVAAGAAGTTITFRQPAADDPTAGLAFFAPTSVTADLSAAVGTQIGSVSARVSAADLGANTVLPLVGTIQVADPATTISFAGTTVPISTLAARCTGTATHGAFWALTLSAAGQTLQLPLFVDAVPAGSPQAAFSTLMIVGCLPPGDVPAGTPGRATFGVKVLEAALTVRGVFSAPPGEHRWRLLALPYTPGTGVPNAAGRVETQSLARAPQAVRLAVRKTKTRGRAMIIGSVTENAQPVPGARVQILRGTRVAGSARTNTAGGYTLTVTAAPGARVRARVTVAARPLGAEACQPTPAFAPAPCIGATAGGFTALSRLVSVPR
jgi:hypothetical protein